MIKTIIEAYLVLVKFYELLNQVGGHGYNAVHNFAAKSLNRLKAVVVCVVGAPFLAALFYGLSNSTVAGGIPLMNDGIWVNPGEVFYGAYPLFWVLGKIILYLTLVYLLAVTIYIYYMSYVGLIALEKISGYFTDKLIQRATIEAAFKRIGGIVAWVLALYIFLVFAPFHRWPAHHLPLFVTVSVAVGFIYAQWFGPQVWARKVVGWVASFGVAIMVCAMFLRMFAPSAYIEYVGYTCHREVVDGKIVKTVPTCRDIVGAGSAWGYMFGAAGHGAKATLIHVGNDIYRTVYDTMDRENQINRVNSARDAQRYNMTQKSNVNDIPPPGYYKSDVDPVRKREYDKLMNSTNL